MCVIALALGASPHWSIVLAANRDESLARDTVPLGWWPQAPHVCGGRDAAAGGTWMGATRDGRFAAVTNVRDVRGTRAAPPNRARSRGLLATGFLVPADGLPQAIHPRTPSPLVANSVRTSHRACPPGTARFARDVAGSIDRFPGFNLLVGDLALGQPWYWIGTRSDGAQALSPGVHALSNGSLNDDWFKTRLLADAVRRAAQCAAADDRELFTTLARTDFPDAHPLPDTGIDAARERQLAPVCVRMPLYGTRSSSVLRVTPGGRVRLVERTWLPGDGFGRPVERCVEFDLAPP